MGIFVNKSKQHTRCRYYGSDRPGCVSGVQDVLFSAHFFIFVSRKTRSILICMPELLKTLFSCLAKKKSAQSPSEARKKKRNKEEERKEKESGEGDE